jgi:branched-chain amino acid transport system ATP-binding protein
VREIAQIVRSIGDEQGVAVLLVEQNARMALGLAKRAYVMETGRIVLAGPAGELAESSHVRAAYLGG